LAKIRVALVGVGNCASSLVQGVKFYQNATGNRAIPGIMHLDLGGYHIADIAAFDIAEGKVGRDSSEAIAASPNNTERFAAVRPTGVDVRRGPTHDGIGRYLRETVIESLQPVDDVAGILRASGAEIVVSYLPVGSEIAARWYAEQALAAGCGYVNRIPVFIAKDARWRERFRERGLPLIGDDIKSQVGATIVHRVLANLFRDLPAQFWQEQQLPKRAAARAPAINRQTGRRQQQVHQRDLGRNLAGQITREHVARCRRAGRRFGFAQPAHRRLRCREALSRSVAPQAYL